MSRPGSPGTQMRLMEMRLLGYLSCEQEAGRVAPQLSAGCWCQSYNNKDELMNSGR